MCVISILHMLTTLKAEYDVNGQDKTYVKESSDTILNQRSGRIVLS